MKTVLVTKWFNYRSINIFKETGGVQDRTRSGRSRTVRTSSVKKLIRERIRRDSARSIQKMDKDLNMSTRSIGRLVNEYLGMKCNKFRKVQLLSEANKQKWLAKCLNLRDRFTSGTHQNIVYSEEKIFAVENAFNKNNDLIIVPYVQIISLEQRTVKTTMKPASVMYGEL